MKLVYEEYCDKNVRGIIAYGKAADHKLYKDEKFTEELTKAEAMDLFKKSLLLIQDTANLMRPVKMTGNKVTTVDGTTAVTGTEWTTKDV